MPLGTLFEMYISLLQYEGASNYSSFKLGEGVTEVVNVSNSGHDLW